MMRIDSKGEGGVWPIMTSSQKSKIFGTSQGVLPKFSLKFPNSGQKSSSKLQVKPNSVWLVARHSLLI